MQNHQFDHGKRRVWRARFRCRAIPSKAAYSWTAWLPEGEQRTRENKAALVRWYEDER